MAAMAAAVQMEVAVAMAAPMPRVRVKCLGMTPEPDHGRESARAARARARAAVAERHKAELKEFAGLDQQMEQVLNSPSTPAVIAELHQLRQECDRVELQWHQGAVDGEMKTAAKVAAAVEDTTVQMAATAEKMISAVRIQMAAATEMIKVRLFMIVLKTIHALVHVCILPTTLRVVHQGILNIMLFYPLVPFQSFHHSILPSLFPRLLNIQTFG